MGDIIKLPVSLRFLNLSKNTLTSDHLGYIIEVHCISSYYVYINLVTKSLHPYIPDRSLAPSSNTGLVKLDVTLNNDLRNIGRSKAQTNTSGKPTGLQVLICTENRISELPTNFNLIGSSLRELQVRAFFKLRIFLYSML